MKSQEFLSLAYQVVLDHYQNPDFDVNQFAQFMGVSRVHLSRNLKRISGRNASGFLREQRLHIAAKRLIAEPDATVTEIAYDAGFGSHAYFSQKFYQLFRLTPTEWRSVPHG
jgi:AraC-like DNA-binding protein